MSYFSWHKIPTKSISVPGCSEKGWILMQDTAQDKCCRSLKHFQYRSIWMLQRGSLLGSRFTPLIIRVGGGKGRGLDSGFWQVFFPSSVCILIHIYLCILMVWRYRSSLQHEKWYQCTDESWIVIGQNGWCWWVFSNSSSNSSRAASHRLMLTHLCFYSNSEFTGTLLIINIEIVRMVKFMGCMEGDSSVR